MNGEVRHESASGSSFQVPVSVPARKGHGCIGSCNAVGVGDLGRGCWFNAPIFVILPPDIFTASIPFVRAESL